MQDGEKPRQRPDYKKSPMDRRTFLRRIATAGGIGAGASYLALAPGAWPFSLRDGTGLRSKPRRKVFRLENHRYSVAKPIGAVDIGIGRRGADPDYAKAIRRDDKVALAQRMLERAMDAIGGLRHYIKRDDIVLIKPNVAFDRSPALGATSNPYLLEALIRMILVDCRAQQVRVADNPIESPSDCFRKSGIDLAVRSAGGRIYLPDVNAFRRLHTPHAEVVEDWWFFHRPFTNVDKVIGIAPVKDHNLCRASMGLKNWYGLLGGARNQFHQNIHAIVSDFALMMKPTFTILDGTNILMQNGPTGGDPSNVKKGDVVLASVDPLGMDAWAFEHLLERGNALPGYLRKAEEKIDLQNRTRDSSGLVYNWKLDYRGRTGEVS